MSTDGKGAYVACPPCEDAEGHQYDDDRHSLLYGLTDWSKVGDPCMWCAHEKCPRCPPPRGLPFAEAHAAGDEECWDFLCPLTQCQDWQARNSVGKGDSR